MKEMLEKMFVVICNSIGFITKGSDLKKRLDELHDLIDALPDDEKLEDKLSASEKEILDLEDNK